ncbi:MAG: universal stress protein [Myxococcales bacterium]|nr:universal stress protein [Myxococcales bacterium]
MAKVLVLIREPLLESIHMKYGLFIARECRKQLVLLTMQSNRPLDELAEKELKKTKSRAKRDGIDCKLIKSKGDAVQAIVRASEAIDLVVINDRSGDNREPTELIPIVKDLVEKARIPALVNFGKESSLKRPLFAISGSDKSRVALRAALLALGGKVFRRGVALHVGKDTDKAHEALDEAAKIANDFEVTLEPQIVDGDVVPTILDVAAKQECDFIVLGTYIRGLLQRALSSSVTEDLLASGALPLLLG